jgi:hypothetical protein
MKIPKMLPAIIILVVVLGTVAMYLRGGGENPFSDIFGVTQEATIALTVVYDDGTEKDYSVTDLSVSSLTITEPVSNRVIKEIRANVQVKADWTGEYKSQSTTGTLKLFNAEWTSAVNTYRFSYTNDLIKGQWVTIASVTYSNMALELWTVNGDNALRIAAALTVKVNFQDGTSDTMDGSGAVNFHVLKGAETGGALTLVNVSVQRTIIE